jgi:hypothetical protein
VARWPERRRNTKSCPCWHTTVPDREVCYSLEWRDVDDIGVNGVVQRERGTCPRARIAVRRREQSRPLLRARRQSWSPW